MATCIRASTDLPINPAFCAPTCDPLAPECPDPDVECIAGVGTHRCWPNYPEPLPQRGEPCEGTCGPGLVCVDTIPSVCPGLCCVDVCDMGDPGSCSGWGPDIICAEIVGIGNIADPHCYEGLGLCSSPT